jgi:CRP-like cAMP-binding protein
LRAKHSQPKYIDRFDAFAMIPECLTSQMPSSEVRNSALEALLTSEKFAFLNSDRVPKSRIEFCEKQILFSRGEEAKNIFYIQEGSVTLAVTSTASKEDVVTILGHGDFAGRS